MLMSSVAIFRDLVCMIVVLLLWIWTVRLVRWNVWFVCAWIMEGPAFLAQVTCLAKASLAVLAPFCLRELLLRRWTPTLSENMSRSGEEVSPKRECVTVPLFLFASPHLGEGSLPERETLSPKWDSSAWARGWARMHQVPFSLLFLYD